MANPKNDLKILAVRNDKLGDFMLAWPAFALLKHYLPQAKITALVPEYTAPAAELCPYIDNILIDRQDKGILALAGRFRKGRFNAMIALFSTTRVALAGMLAGIPYRLAPATKIAQLLYSHKLLQQRSLSEKPEHLYNSELAAQLLIDLKIVPDTFTLEFRENDHLPKEVTRPLLELDSSREQIRNSFLQQHNIPSNSKLIFVHPGSGGSSVTLSPEQYADLVNEVTEKSSQQVSIVICAGPDELEVAQNLQALLSDKATSSIYHSTNGLRQFIETLQIADLFISGSTGTLHIAGALDIPTVGFYPTKQSSTSLRWQTLSDPKHRLELDLSKRTHQYQKIFLMLDILWEQH